MAQEKTKRIRMLTLMAGPGGVRPMNSEHTLPLKEADGLIAAGAAEEVVPEKVEAKAEAEAKEKAEAEAAKVEPPETAAKPPARGKKAGK